MRSIRRAVPALLLPAFFATTTHASGINLAWNNCITQPGAAENMNYACDGSRLGNPFKLVASFKSPADLSAFLGVQMVIDIGGQTLPPIFSPEPLSDWWRLGLGECRDGNLAFPTSLQGIGTGSGTTTVCFNPWAGANLGGAYQYTSFHGGSNWRARLLLAFARDSEIPLATGQHYLAGAVTLDTGTDLPSGTYPTQCLGCCQPMLIVLSQIELYQTAGQLPPQQDIYVLTQADIRQYVTWQFSGTCQQTPARRASWGSIKATYR